MKKLANLKKLTKTAMKAVTGGTLDPKICLTEGEPGCRRFCWDPSGNGGGTCINGDCYCDM